jgi:hypothetical protein
MRRVKIKALPKDLTQAKDGHETAAKLWNGIQQNWPTVMNEFSLPQTSAGRTLQPVDREDANLEAEKGETAIINQDGIPTNFTVGGKRHSEGGTPLNLPSNSFIFSDTKDMKIKDKDVLAQFNVSKSMTPADISKKYDINKFRGVLADPDSTDLERKTAEMMIGNYNMKLAKLGLAQEAKKGFPQGIPAISVPYIESLNINPNDFFTTQAQPEQFNPDINAARGGTLPKAQSGKMIPGFGEESKAGEFAKLYPDIYGMYMQGLNSNKPEDMISTANEILKQQKSQTPWYSLDMVPWSDADKFSDIAGILKEKASNLTASNSIKKIQEENKANDFKFLQLLNKKKMEYDALPATEYKKRAEKSSEMNELHNLIYTANQQGSLPNPYKGRNNPQAELDYMKNYPKYHGITLPGVVPTSSNEVVVPPVKAAVPNTDTVKVVVKGKNPYLQSKALGGSLDQYQVGGKVRTENYDDGTSAVIDIKTGVVKTYSGPNATGTILNVTTTKAAPATNPSTTSNTNTSKGTGTAQSDEIKIYTPETEAWIAAQVAAGKTVILPKEVPPGSYRKPVQSGVKGEQNLFGKVTWSPKEEADFKARHPWVYEQKPDFNPKDPKIVGKWTENVGHHKIGDPMTKGDQDTLWVQQEYDKINPGYFKQKGVIGTDIDSDFGAHTYSMPGVTGKAVDPATSEAEKTATVVADKKKAAVAAMATQQQPGHDPWWLQDIVKTAGAAGDFFRVKKYAPWQATPGIKLPDPTFYDPSRELAANAEMANIGVQGANAFTNPQAFASVFSEIQGQGAKNAADILGKYNQMNVGVANDFEMKRTDIMNQSAANNAGLATQLADKYAIMNQQFDNSKNQARQNLRQSYIDAVTNKNYTGNMNDLYDQYKIDPSTGGRIRWTHGRPINPEESDQDMITKINATALALRKQNPGLDADKAVEHAIKLHSAGAVQGNKMYGQEALGYPGGQGQGPAQ